MHEPYADPTTLLKELDTLRARVAELESEAATLLAGKALHTAERREDAPCAELQLQQLQSILESIDEPIYVSDPNTFELLYVNHAFRRYWGEVIGRQCFEVLQGRDSPCEFCTNHLIFGEKAGQPHVWEFQNLINKRWYRCIDRAIPWPDGRLVRYEMAIDITERKRAEQALAESQRILSTLMSNLPGMVYRCLNDPNWTMTFVSEGCTELTGYQPADLADNKHVSFSDIIHPDDKHHVWTTVQAALQSRRPFQITYRIITAQSTEKWVWEQGRGVFSDEGELLFLEGFIADITERKRIEEQFLQAQKLESIGTLAGGIAHDFNNLLAVIMGNAAIVQKPPPLPPKKQEAMADIVTAAERGSALTQQLLAYARGGVLKPTPTDLNRLIRSVLPMLQRAAPPGIQFVLKLKLDLPLIMADPVRIEQVLMNLVLNAIQASQAPGNITIGTTARTLSRPLADRLQMAPDTYVQLRVHDRGCGIEPGIIDRIFDPFFTTKKTGRGMGLSAAHGIVRGHHGQIKLSSKPGKGTVAAVWLPIASQPEAAVHSPQPPRERPPRGNETVLIIDDEPAVSQTIQHMLSSLGYCVITHSDTDRAQVFLASNAEDINLAICDMNMPKCTGREMAELIAARYPHITVLLTSGLDDGQADRSAGTSNVAGFLHKPFTLMELAKAVRAALDS